MTASGAAAPDATVVTPGGTVLRRVEPVMGTVVSFTVDRGGLDEAGARGALEQACEVLHRADAVFSTWDPGSPVSRLRRGEARLDELPDSVSHVLELCRAVKEASEGWFDPWAIPGGVDPTGLVKGWAVGRAVEVVRSAGAGAAIVNGGGDVATFGRPSTGPRWRIGIRHPWRADALAAVVEAEGQVAVATSATYERGEHLFDPFRQRATSAAASATVVGPDPAWADALATGLAVAGHAGLSFVAACPGYEAYLVGRDGSEAATEGFPFGQA